MGFSLKIELEKVGVGVRVRVGVRVVKIRCRGLSTEELGLVIGGLSNQESCRLKLESELGFA